MLLRKWVVRGLVGMVLAACLGASVIYQQWTNPAAVRQQVLDMLEKQFPGATVTLDRARLRLLGGGVELTELHLLRRLVDSSNGTLENAPSDIVHIPQALVYLDKERFAAGKVGLARIEMSGPRVHIIRTKDGKWNFDGLAGKSDANSPLPPIVIHKGTLIFEDRYAGPATWILGDLELTLTNDADNCLSFSGKGISETFGTIEVDGRLNRTTFAIELSLRATDMSINRELVQYVASQWKDERLEGLQLDGKADISAKIVYQPEATPALTHDFRARLRQTCVEHPNLPVSLHNLSASLRCAEGKLTLERLKAAAGKGKVECKGWVDLADMENTYQVELTAFHLPVTEELIKRLPENAHKVREMYGLFNPVGSTKFQYVAEKKGEWVRKSCTLEPDDISVCFSRFPYPVDHLSGVITHDFLQNVSKFRAVGYTGSRPIALEGYWLGSGSQANAEIVIAGQDIPLDIKLHNALNVKLKKLAEEFNPVGKGSFRALIRRVPGSLDMQNTFEIHFTDCNVQWDTFRYPLEHVSGDLTVYPCPVGAEPQYEFGNFVGTHHGGTVFVSGQRFDGKNDGRLVVNIKGENLNLDNDLRYALEKSPYPRLATTWDSFAPAGRFSFKCQVEHSSDHRAPNQHYDMDIDVEVAGCAIKPTFLPCQFQDVTGHFRYHKNKVELNNFTARHNDGKISIHHAAIDCGLEDDFYVELYDLRANSLRADPELLSALPGKVKSMLEAIHLSGQAFDLSANKLVVAKNSINKNPDIWWDAEIWLHDVELKAGIDLSHVTGTMACKGRHNGNFLGLIGNVYLNEATILGQPFRGVRAHFEVNEKSPEVMWFNMQAPLFGGDISGVGRLGFYSTLDYKMDLTASQIQLQQFGTHNLGPKHQLAGIAGGQLHLEGIGDDLNNLDGRGTIDVPYSPTTRLVNLPLLLDLLEFLALRGPDRTMFEEAHAAFTIRGNRASISKLDLQGNSVSVYGKGEVNLNGTGLKLDMYPTWGRAEQLLPSVLSSMPSAISKQFLKIEVRGKVGGKEGDLQFSKRFVPTLTDPFVRMMSGPGAGDK